MKDCFIEGDLIYLRLPDIQRDVIDGNWHEWFNDDNITEYLYHGVYPNNLDKQISIVEDNLTKDDMVLLSIVDKTTDKICGIVSLKDIDLLNRVAEVTIVMDKENYPENSPFEVWALITQYGFDKLNLNKINSGHHFGLWKWVNKIELIGYKLEGYIKSTHIKYGKVNDMVRVGITAKDYYNLLEERDGKYLTSDLKSLLRQRRKENLCEKLGSMIDGLYE